MDEYTFTVRLGDNEYDIFLCSDKVYIQYG